jgi:hypothetical protein
MKVEIPKNIKGENEMEKLGKFVVKVLLAIGGLAVIDKIRTKAYIEGYRKGMDFAEDLLPAEKITDQTLED